MYEQATNYFMVATYLAYLVATIGITIWVAKTLHKNGRIFLVDAFLGKEALADSVNHLLVVGFYLVNIGFVALALKESMPIFTAQAAIELVCTKVGQVLLVLGGMHFFNLYLFHKLRRKGQMRFEPPPVPPTEYLPRMAAVGNAR